MNREIYERISLKAKSKIQVLNTRIPNRVEKFLASQARHRMFSGRAALPRSPNQSRRRSLQTATKHRPTQFACVNRQPGAFTLDFHASGFLPRLHGMNEIQDSATDPRIYMSAERTFLAWLRTGIAFMGFGFVVARFGLFLREMAAGNNAAAPQPGPGFSLPAGVVLIVLGIVVNIVAAIRHHRYVKALDRGQFRQAYGPGFAVWVAGLLAVIGLAVAIYLVAML